MSSNLPFFATAAGKLHGPEPLHTFNVVWSPEGRVIATVEASSARAACRQAPLPYRKFLGELYAVRA